MYNAANNASSQLAQAISAADTSLTVLDGSSFPDAPFVVSIEDEIIEVGAKSGNTFSGLVRGLEGTAPAAHASGSRVENRFTAGTYQQIVDKINNLKAEEIEYTSEVTSFTPTQVAAALDELAGVRIVEMGSNANGEYVRWENGLQVCWGRHSFGIVLAGASVEATWTYPSEFASTPIVSIASNHGGSEFHKSAFRHGANPGMSSATVATTNATSTDRSCLAALIAIGRWK